MQTFLPYESFTKTAKVLDWRRLGKQRVEGMQIIQTIEKQNGWKNHPIVKMWTPYVPALKQYTNIIITEWIGRGYNNNMEFYDIDNVEYPDWLGDKRFHSSHRANLLRKDFDWYSQFGWTENSESPYLWKDTTGWYEQPTGQKNRYYL
jgi:hypothetical protein